jgi:hypothetical protein
MRPGDIGCRYVGAWEPFLSALSGPGRATVFICDPRHDRFTCILCHFDAPGHWMREYYTETLSTMEELDPTRYPGREALRVRAEPVRERYAGYLGWLGQPGVLCLRFEDLVLDRERTLGCLLDYLEERGFQPETDRARAIEILGASIAPQKSGTFRKGQPGNWREHFTPANKAVFKEQTGDLLVRLGYEQDGDW